MSNSFGSRYRFTIFGQSHAPAIGVTIEGLPAGFSPDMEALGAFLARRAPGQGPYSTPRKEADRPEFIAGLVDGHTCGAPVTAVIYNTNTRSGDYENLRRVPRPSHADYAAWVKYGDARDVAGGGQFSGRLTAPLCVAGGLALQLLEQEGVSIRARILSIGGETEPEKMRSRLDGAKAAGDSLGGVIECVCQGVPAGLGEPMFGGMENRISQAVFAIPAVKGIEFGAGFAAAGLTGSQNNDPFYYDASGVVRTRTNNHGGILGGITSGMPIVFRAAVKPTPSIGIEQDSVDLTAGTNVKLTVSGRHDPCIVPRAVPCMEAAAACAVYDALLENRN
ncbi:MAG: chorismate synthase [Oscillospiraceae bacterium]|nr:chorismate synthase [Oscillospiraceae bacterium]